MYRCTIVTKLQKTNSKMNFIKDKSTACFMEKLEKYGKAPLFFSFLEKLNNF